MPTSKKTPAPGKGSIDIEQRISRSIRQGYLGRNTLTPEYARGMADSFAVMKDKGSYGMVQGMKTAASGFTIIGVSGVGKSMAVERILSLYPQRIIHVRYKEEPLALTQLVWLKLDCPHDGSLKQPATSSFMCWIWRQGQIISSSIPKGDMPWTCF